MVGEQNTPIAVDSKLETKRRSLLPVMGVVSVIIVGALVFYLGLQKSAIEAEVKSLTGQITSLQEEAESMEDQKIQVTKLAKQWIENIEKDEIRWSGVFTRIQSLLPFDAVSKKMKVSFLSYNGSEGGRLNIIARTEPAPIEPFFDVADLIERFNKSSFFENATVPSITRGETDKGEKFLSFNFNLIYKEDFSSENNSPEPVLEELEEKDVVPAENKTPRPNTKTPVVSTPQVKTSESNTASQAKIPRNK